ncbi:type IV pilus modification protein PilV [Rhodanobacter koreensis]
MNRLSCARTKGFTLMEVLVALVIISIGLLGIAAMQATAIASTHTSQTESLAAIEARSLADAMQANPDYWASGNMPATISVTGTAAAPVLSDTTLNSQATDCSTTPCLKTATDLGNVAMAGYDLQQWAKQLFTQIPGSNATITCQIGSPSICSITVTWTQKATAAVNNGTQSKATLANNMSYTLVNQF